VSIDYTLINRKIDVAVREMMRKDIDMWLTFGEESEMGGDPMIKDLLGLDVVGETAIIVTKDGQRRAVLAGYDAEGPGKSDVWDVTDYSEDIVIPLRSIVNELAPKSIAINYSRRFTLASGLSAAHRDLLKEALPEYADGFVPAEDIIVAMRGVKLPEELKRIKRAVKITEAILDEVTDFLKPGITEAELADHVRQLVLLRECGFAWGDEMCPIVSFGKNTGYAAHRPGSDKELRKGELVTMDFGVEYHGQVSDMQRTWYMLMDGETRAPERYLEAFATALEASEAVVAGLKDGAVGFDLDNLAKDIIKTAGYEPVPFCTGHPIGRSAHEIGALLGPDKKRYRGMAFIELKENQVYAVEPTVRVEGEFSIGLEENVLVTRDGGQYLSEPQKKIIYV
jgi:Xaa-Pro aminopeptidase